MKRITIRLTEADHMSLARAAEFYKMDVGAFMIEIALADSRRLLPILDMIESHPKDDEVSVTGASPDDNDGDGKS
jgi:uncharacterized protein (DUF1778 family)